MFNKTQFNTILKSRNITGLEVIFLAEGGLEFNQAVLKKSKTSIEIEVVHTGIKTFEEIQKKLDPRLPVNIVINGKGIIHKKVALNEGDTDAKLLEKVFPNARISDFYLQRTRLSDDLIFVSIVRKNTIDDLLASFTKAGYYFSGITLGPFCLNSVFPLMGISPGEADMAGYRLNINNESCIEEFQYNGIYSSLEKICIAGEKLKQQAVISFAGAFQYFSSYHENVLTGVPVVEMNKSELEQKKLLRMAGWTILFFFLTILLINFLLFDYYSKQYQQLEAVFASSKEQLASINDLKVKVKEKQAFIEKTGLKRVSRTSYYADKLASGMPSSIRLTELLIYPPEKKLKKEEPVIFLKEIIIIKGVCAKSTELNEWIRSIKENDWVNDVAVLNYKQEKANNPGEFEIKIIIG